MRVGDERGTCPGMVADARCRISKRSDGVYFVYLPKNLVEDSMFPFPPESSLELRVSFKPGGEKSLTIEPIEPRD